MPAKRTAPKTKAANNVGSLATTPAVPSLQPKPTGSQLKLHPSVMLAIPAEPKPKPKK